jgi:hypothetical protein
LEAVTDGLTIDVITVGAFRIGGTNVVFPQRIDAEHHDRGEQSPPGSADPGLVPGANDFITAAEHAPADQRAFLLRLVRWAQQLESQGLVRLSTYHGKSGRKTLLPRLHAGNAGLVTLYRDTNAAYLQFWRSVFERRAPRSLPAVERLAGEVGVGQGNVTYDVSDDLLAALTDAYREAALGQLASQPSHPPSDLTAHRPVKSPGSRCAWAHGPREQPLSEGSGASRFGARMPTGVTPDDDAVARPLRPFAARTGFGHTIANYGR